MFHPQGARHGECEAQAVKPRCLYPGNLLMAKLPVTNTFNSDSLVSELPLQKTRLNYSL